MPDFYPLNLVLAVALAWATIFLGSLPLRLIRAPIFVRQVLWAAGGWMLVALLSSGDIRHFHVMVGLVCLVSWWKLRGDRYFSGKLWLATAAALGASLGVVLILAVTPEAWPPGLPTWNRALELVSLYLGGAVIGLAYALHAFTRRAATQAGISSQTVDGLSTLLVRLTWLRAVVLLAAFLAAAIYRQGPNFLERPGAVSLSAGLHVLACASALMVLPTLAALGRKRSRSPAPSTAGPVLLALAAAGFVTEGLICWNAPWAL